MYWTQYGFAKRSQERRWQNQKIYLIKKKCYIWYIERKFNEKCGHLNRPFKERASFVMEQLVLKRIM